MVNVITFFLKLNLSYLKPAITPKLHHHSLIHNITKYRTIQLTALYKVYVCKKWAYLWTKELLNEQIYMSVTSNNISLRRKKLIYAHTITYKLFISCNWLYKHQLLFKRSRIFIFIISEKKFGFYSLNSYIKHFSMFKTISECLRLIFNFNIPKNL